MAEVNFDAMTPDEVLEWAKQAHIEVGTLKRENAERRLKAEELEAQARDREAGDQSEAEQLTAANKRADTAEATLKQARIDWAVERAAAVAGFANPQDAVALLDLSAVTVDEQGKVTGFEQSLKALVESKRLPMVAPGDGLGTPSQNRTKQPDKDGDRASTGEYRPATVRDVW